MNRVLFDRKIPKAKVSYYTFINVKLWNNEHAYMCAKKRALYWTWPDFMAYCKDKYMFRCPRAQKCKWKLVRNEYIGHKTKLHRLPTVRCIYSRGVFATYVSTLNNNSFAKFRWAEMKWKSWRAHWLLSRLEHAWNTKEKSVAGKRKYGNEVPPEIKHRRARFVSMAESSQNQLMQYDMK